MHTRTVVFLVYHILAIPLFALYVIELAILRLRADFTSAFYTLFFFGGITDLVFFIINVVVYQLSFLPGVSTIFLALTPGNPEWSKYSWIISFLNSSLYYFPGLQDVNNVLIAVDRFLALHYPMTYRNLFSGRKYLIVLVIILSLGYSLIHCLPNLGAKVYAIDVTFSNTTEPIFMLFSSSRFMIPQSVLTFSLTLLHSCICVLIYCAIGASLYTQKWKHSASQLVEIRMVVLGFAILLANVPSILYQGFWFVFGYTYGDIVYMTLPWCVLCKSLSPPLLMLITNSQMRRELRQRFSRGFSTMRRSTVNSLPATPTVFTASSTAATFVK